VPLESKSEGITAPAVTAIYDMTKPASSVNNASSGGEVLFVTSISGWKREQLIEGRFLLHLGYALQPF
jgi:hypothetical protein